MDNNTKPRQIERERFSLLMDYVSYTLNGELDKITEDMKPKDEIEENWVKSGIELRKERREEREDFQKRKELIYTEAEEVLRKYLPKEYWSNGYFNSDEFIKLKEEIEERAYGEIDDIIEKKKLLREMFVFGPWRVFSNQEIYVTNRTVEILKDEYKIDWKPIHSVAPKEYIKKIQQLEKKYGIHIDEY